MRCMGRTGRSAGRSWLAWPSVLTVLGGLVLVLFGLAVSLAVIGHTGAGLSFAALPVALLGLVIARRQPGNRIAWLLLGFSAVFAFYGDAAGYAVWDYHFDGGRLPLGPAAVVIASELWIAVFLVLPLVILLFPDGGLPPRWSVVMRAYLAVCAVIVAIQVAAGVSQVSGTRIVVTDKGQLVSNPGPTGILAIPFVILLVAVPVFWVLFVARQVLSWRVASGERRAQLKWLMAGGVATLVGLATTFVFAQFSGSLALVLDSIMLGVGIFSLPASICIAILKYHLYDIDRVISRTVSYTLVTGLLVGVYTGLVLLATHVLTITSPVGVAASTLAVAALFNPVRRRVQRLVDRRFNRARYDSDQTVALFASRLKDEVDLDSVRADLAGAVQRALEPAHITLWLSPDAGHPASRPR
jgi:hypothetical protein